MNRVTHGQSRAALSAGPAELEANGFPRGHLQHPASLKPLSQVFERPPEARPLDTLERCPKVGFRIAAPEAPVGSIRFVYFSGDERTMKVRPYKSEEWETQFTTFTEAVREAALQSGIWEGVAFGVVKKAALFQIFPLETERGSAFPLDKSGLAGLGIKDAFGSSSVPHFVAAVGLDAYVNLSSNRTDQPLTPIP
jgi:hypothetical protein